MKSGQLTDKIPDNCRTKAGQLSKWHKAIFGQLSGFLRIKIAVSLKLFKAL